jgi:hypothetical protein
MDHPVLPNTLPAKLKRFIRAFSLLWSRMGPARIYVAVAVSVVIALAALGVWHLYSWLKQAQQSRVNRPAMTASQSARIAKTPEAASPANQISAQMPAVSSAPEAASDVERAIAITDVRETKRRGRHGETFVVATIGMAPRAKVEKGDVEIRVFFYDLTANNEMRPTDAQVTYQWLTPFRDWNDPTPKYLAATYLKPRMPRRSSNELRYGGFVVRVYDGGKLQDERSEPEELLSVLRSSAQQSPSQSPNTNTSAVIPATPGEVASPISEKKATANTSTPSPIISPSPAEQSVSQDATLPYGKPVPGKAGFVSSPFEPKFIIDVRGFPRGTLVNDPITHKPFRVP